MSVDSYFFASFSNNEKAYKAIQKLLESRPRQDLPRMPSNASIMSAATLDPETRSVRSQKSFDDRSSGKRRGSDATLPPGLGSLRKLGNVIKPLVSRGNASSDEVDEPADEAVHEEDGKPRSKGFGISLLKPKSHTPSNDSHDTLQGDEALDADGYPPKQSGRPPPSMHEDSSKSSLKSWITKPSKLFSSSPSKSTEPSRAHSVKKAYWAGQTTATDRHGVSKRGSVTEVVEPGHPDSSDGESSDDDDETFASRRRGKAGTARMSFGSGDDANDRSEYSMMEQSEGGQREEDEMARKFRNVFSLSDKEELIERKSRSRGFDNDAHRRLPGIPLPCLACIRAVLCLDQLLLFPLVSASIQDQGEAGSM